MHVDATPAHVRAETVQETARATTHVEQHGLLDAALGRVRVRKRVEVAIPPVGVFKIVDSLVLVDAHAGIVSGSGTSAQAQLRYT
jgi:hypothetical protein